MKRVDNDTILRSVDPMQTITTQKMDYIPHQVNRVSFHQPDKYKQPEGEMDTTSSYAREYNYKTQDRVKPIRHERTKAVLADFDPTTTNKSDYRQWSMPKTKTFGPERRYERPEEVFQGASTYNNDFHKHRSETRDLIKPVGNTQLSTEPFNDVTSNRHDFTRHELPPKFVKPIKSYTPNRIPLDAMTTMKSDYGVKNPMARMQSFKPANNGVHSEEPFNASTTNKEDFKQWLVTPNLVKRDTEYVQPLGEMDLNTNYNRDFTGTHARPAIAIRPAVRKTMDAKFEGQSTYEMDFQKLNQQRRTPIKGVSEFHLPDAPFEGQSTYKTTHYGTKGYAATSTKPNLVHVAPADPFVADTSYRTEYTKKSKF